MKDTVYIQYVNYLGTYSPTRMRCTRRLWVSLYASYLSYIMSSVSTANVSTGSLSNRRNSSKYSDDWPYDSMKVSTYVVGAYGKTVVKRIKGIT